MHPATQVCPNLLAQNRTPFKLFKTGFPPPQRTMRALLTRRRCIRGDTCTRQWRGRRWPCSGTGTSGGSRCRRSQGRSAPRSASPWSPRSSGRPRWWGCTGPRSCTGSGCCSGVPSGRCHTLDGQREKSVVGLEKFIWAQHWWCCESAYEMEIAIPPWSLRIVAGRSDFIHAIYAIDSSQEKLTLQNTSLRNKCVFESLNSQNFSLWLCHQTMSFPLQREVLLT